MKASTTLVSALFAAGLGVAFAQEPAGQEAEQEIAAADRPQSEAFLTGTEQGLIRTDVLERSDLVDSQGEDIGNISGVLIDEQSGEVAGVLVNLGGIAGVGSRTVGLSWDAVEIAPDSDGGLGPERYEVRTQMSAQDFENAPEFEDDEDQVALGD